MVRPLYFASLCQHRRIFTRGAGLWLALLGRPKMYCTMFQQHYVCTLIYVLDYLNQEPEHLHYRHSYGWYYRLDARWAVFACLDWPDVVCETNSQSQNEHGSLGGVRSHWERAFGSHWQRFCVRD